MSDDAVAAPRRVIPDKSSCFYPPRKVPERWVTFINLEDKPEGFNITKVKKQWPGHRYSKDWAGDANCERGEEFTYSIRRPGATAWTERRRSGLKLDGIMLVGLKDQVMCRLPRGRFVLIFLVYSGPGGQPSLARELSHSDAALWFMLNVIDPPPPLKRFKFNLSPDPSQDPSSRLNREWQPPMVGTLESVDACQELERGETETRADVERMGEPVEVQAGPFAETIRRLKRCTRQAELVRYLWDRTEREAELRLVAKDVFGVSDARFHARKRSVRKQLERTRDSLEAKDCPLRLVISANSVSLRVVQMSS